MRQSFNSISSPFLTNSAYILPPSSAVSPVKSITCVSDKSLSVFSKASLLGDLNAPTLSSATVIADVNASFSFCKLLKSDLEDFDCTVLRTSTKIEVSMNSFIPALFFSVLSQMPHCPRRIPTRQQLILQHPLQACSFPSPDPVSNGGFSPSRSTSSQFLEYSCVPFNSYPLIQLYDNPVRNSFRSSTALTTFSLIIPLPYMISRLPGYITFQAASIGGLRAPHA